ncbi:MAG: SDR family oxidoreductase [Coriobacteriales bacterium]|jgi:NAD(P)-dependent dehydrogenase (short-subunit alcohol dehydrogenase family)|nr:SDR family oxidoreductase [Coriobacteriales bacterium]
MEHPRSILKGKVAIVTGANRMGSIGAAISYLFAESKARVIMTARNIDELNKVVRSFGHCGSGISTLYGDMTEESDIENITKVTAERFGHLDILVNNAGENGLCGDEDVVNLDVSVWDRIFETNARGTMLMAKHAIPLMIKEGGGSIINISSGFASVGHIAHTAYACSKAAINTLTRYIAAQYGPQGIRCNSVSPGLIQTNGSSLMPESVADAYRENCLLPRLGRPIDVAKLVGFLASDESDYMTGQNLIIDGGFGSHVPFSIAKAESEFSGWPG